MQKELYFKKHADKKYTNATFLQTQKVRIINYF